MKKRQFLSPLAVSVAALLGGARVPAQAATDLARVPAAAASEASAPMAADHLVLTRSVLGVNFGWLITSHMLPTRRTPAIHPMRLEADSLPRWSIDEGQVCVSDARLFLAGLQH
jgi:hypothetical protein